MPAPAAAPPYLKTHGAKVARRHEVDWVVLLLLAAAAVVLNFIEPFHRFVGKGMLDSLLYPLHDNTVPIWAIPVLAVLVPVLIFAGVYVKQRNAYDLHHAVLGLLFSVLVTAVITEAIKDGVGRPRPDFYWRCFPDGVPNYNNITGQVICHGDAGVIKEGHKSFPSGHTSFSFAGLGFLSWYLAGKLRAFDRGDHIAKLCIVVLLLPMLLAAMVGVSRVDDYWHHWYKQILFAVAGSFAGLGYLSWYLAGKIKAFDQRGHVYKLCIVIFPLLLAAMVGVSRVADYWHHWQDVFAGGILGLVVSSFCYLQFFPSPVGEHGHRCHAYHHHILNPEAETQATTSSASDHHLSVLPRDLSVVSQAVSMEMRSNNRALDAMEAGSRDR